MRGRENPGLEPGGKYRIINKSNEYKLFVRNKDDDPDGRKLLKMLIALPLLLETRCLEGLSFILNYLSTAYKNDNKQKGWKKFITYYFQKEWIQRVGPKTFSMYLENDRTNNYVESYHQSLNQTIRAKPSCRVFISKWNV